MTEFVVNLSAGQQMAAIPGPSIIPQRVLEAMARPMTDLYDGPVIGVSNDLRAALPVLAGTEGEVFIVTSNGHGAWQMATSNTLSRGDKVLVLESGRFASFWGQYTGVSDVDVEFLPGTLRDPIDPAALQSRLEADVDRQIKAILCVHVDTASSVRNDIPALRAAIDAVDHPALLMVDCIASMGCEEFLMDDWGVDVALAGCQKGLMVPPGVAFVWAGPRALEANKTADLRVGYFDWAERLSAASQYHYFAGTPPMAHLFALHVAFQMVEEEGGWAKVWQRHTALADGVRAAVDAWAHSEGFEFNIGAAEHRANCVTTIRTNSIDAEELRRRCDQDAGLVLGLGLADIPGFRLAHMGHLNPPMLLGAIGTIEAVLVAMDAPMGASGVAAAATSMGHALRNRDS
ncbi:MAG: alanine-glyoxylate transaminase/serine-glyoxylate transaminase/serine-pyruvate transaminase [Acidimicrobiales bacterium]